MSGNSESVKGRSEVPEEILDATCGGRSIWLDGNKRRNDTRYIDRREEEPGFLGQDGRTYSVDPDEIQDFRDLPYPDESFNLIVFDPPHKRLSNGMESLDGIMNRAYGALHAETWQADLRQGFDELWRVLRPGGTLVFKFADSEINFRDVLDLAPTEPLFGTTTTQKKTSETRWFVFYKPEAPRNSRPQDTDDDLDIRTDGGFDEGSSGRQQVFETTYHCENCGNEWQDQHPPRTIVERSAAAGGVIVRNKDCDQMLNSGCDCCRTVFCPVCELREEVQVSARGPVETEERSTADDDPEIRTDGGVDEGGKGRQDDPTCEGSGCDTRLSEIVEWWALETAGNPVRTVRFLCSDCWDRAKDPETGTVEVDEDGNRTLGAYS